jgi:hypothetical protein
MVSALTEKTDRKKVMMRALWCWRGQIPDILQAFLAQEIVMQEILRQEMVAQKRHPQSPFPSSPFPSSPVS